MTADSGIRGGRDGEQACLADGALGRLNTMTDLALDDGRTQGSLGSVVGGLDSLSLQEGPEAIDHLEQLLAGAHRLGPRRSLAALYTQLHHPLQPGLKLQPDRLAAVLQAGPVDRYVLVAVPVGKKLQLQAQQFCADLRTGARAFGDGEIADQIRPAQLPLLGG